MRSPLHSHLSSLVQRLRHRSIDDDDWTLIVLNEEVLIEEVLNEVLNEVLIDVE